MNPAEPRLNSAEKANADIEGKPFKCCAGSFEYGSAGIFKQSMGARNRVGIGLSYRPTRIHRQAKLIPWNRFLGSLKV